MKLKIDETKKQLCMTCNKETGKYAHGVGNQPYCQEHKAKPKFYYCDTCGKHHTLFWTFCKDEGVNKHV